MFPILHLGPLAIQTPGLILLVGLWIALGQMERYAPCFQVAAGLLYNLVLMAIVAGLAGARIFYILRFPEAFLSHPMGMLSLNPAMLDLEGGLLAGLVAAFIYGQKKGLALWPVLDALTPVLAVLAITFGGMHLASGEAYGVPTSLPWGIELWGATRHPSQVYEIASGVLVALAIWPRGSQPVDEATAIPIPAGRLFWLFVALTAGTRVFLEAFRGDSWLVFGQLRVAQLVAWVILGIGLWQLGLRREKPVEG